MAAVIRCGLLLAACGSLRDAVCAEDNKATTTKSTSTEPAIAELPESAAGKATSKDSKEEKGREPDAKDEKKEEKKKPKPARREVDGSDVIPGALGGTGEESRSLSRARHALRTAQLHFRIGLLEQGNLEAFDSAAIALNRARLDLEVLHPSEKGPKAEHAAALAWIEEFSEKLHNARRLAKSTLAGRFPLIRGFGLDLVDEDEDLAIYSYPIKDTARRQAVFMACRRLAKLASSDPLHVLVLLPGQNANDREKSEFALLADAESQLAFATVPHLTVYPGSVRNAVDAMPAWDAPDAAFDPICRQFLKFVHRDSDPHGVMLVMLREFTDEVGDAHWVQAQHRTFGISALEKAEEDPDDLEADRVRVAEALTRDKSRLTSGLFTGVGLLLLLAIVVHGLALRRTAPYVTGWHNRLAIPTAGFLLGIVVAPLVIFALGQTIPHADSDALLNSWWPCAAGALSLILPAAVFRLGMGSIGRYVPSVSCHGRWGVSFLPVALGATGAWMWSATYAFGAESLPLVCSIGLASSLLVYCFGRAIDLADEFPLGLGSVALVLTLVFGAAAFLGSTSLLMSVAGLALATSISHRILLKRRESKTAELEGAGTSPVEPNGQVPKTLEELQVALQAPQYQPPRAFEELRAAFDRPDAQGTSWIGLVGPSAAGKTAAARYLLRELQAADRDLMVLSGRCSEDGTPYQPFREALSEVGVPAAFIAARMQGGGMTGMLDRLADEFIPFWDFFSGSSSSDDDEDEEANRGELFMAVTNALHTLIRDHRLILFLDDVQWIDEGSASLLKHLRESFAPPSEARPVILVAGREKESLERLGMEEGILSITPPTAAEQVRILERGLGIHRASARRLVEAMGTLSREAEGMFWLVRAVQELVSSEAFTATPKGFMLQKAYLSGKQLPVPSAMRARIAASVQASAEHRTILECAALLGETFRVDELAECLRMDRLELLKILRRLEQELQLVRDLPHDQECYAFSSAFVLEIVRDELGVGAGRGERNPSKIARELHARIAVVLEGRKPRTPELIQRIARHYHRAGTAHAAKSLEFCLAAARIERGQKSFRDARRFLSMAEQSARRSGTEIDLIRERVLIEAEEALSSGVGIVSAATAVTQALGDSRQVRRADRHVAAELCLRAGKETGDQSWSQLRQKYEALDSGKKSSNDPRT
jgi:hypothetical protein